MTKEDQKLNKMFHSLSLKYNMPVKDIKELVNSPYEFTEEKLKTIDINKINSTEDEENVDTNFIYKYIGKLHTNFKLINRRRKQSEAFRKINKAKWENKKISQKNN